jgi:hypothetical protein
MYFPYFPLLCFFFGMDIISHIGYVDKAGRKSVEFQRKIFRRMKKESKAVMLK